MAALKALRTLRDRRMARLPHYEDISPSSRWTESMDDRRIIIDLTGFKKEEVNMEIDESGNVSIRGRHGIGNNRFQRFSQTFRAPEDTEMKGIVGNLEDGLYTVVFPKKVAVEAVQEAKLRDCAGEEGVEETDEKLEVPEAEAEKATKTLESPTVMPQSSTKMEKTGALEPETFTKPAETDTDNGANASENATTLIDAAPALREPNSSSEMTEPKTAAILYQCRPHCWGSK